MEIKNFTEKHYFQVANIYKQGIETGFSTFQDEVPNWQSWDKSHLQTCRVAVFEDDLMLGWAALSPVSSRCVYGGVAEVSIYVATQFRNKGIGEMLMKHLISESEKAGFWTLQSGIFAENTGSIKLHENCGFRQIGYREKIGQKKDVWKDNVIMERRSKIIGI